MFYTDSIQFRIGGISLKMKQESQLMEGSLSKTFNRLLTETQLKSCRDNFTLRRFENAEQNEKQVIKC